MSGSVGTENAAGGIGFDLWYMGSGASGFALLSTPPDDELHGLEVLAAVFVVAIADT